MSGYASLREVREVAQATLRQEGRDPAGYNVTGIMRDAFYHRGPGYGYGACDKAAWDDAVARHRRRGYTAYCEIAEEIGGQPGDLFPLTLTDFDPKAVRLARQWAQTHGRQWPPAPRCSVPTVTITSM